MLEKLNFDNITEKVENISNKVDIIMRNRLIIAIFFIVDGITFIFTPNESITGMARSIIMFVLMASFSVLVTNISSKTKDIKSIIMSALVIIIGIIIFIFPQVLSAYIQVLFALFIIYDGIINILNTLKLNKLSNFTQIIIEKLNNITNPKNINKDFDNGMEEQKERFMSPLKNMVDKTNKFSIIYLLANIVSIILGTSLLLFSDVSIIVCGVIFIYTGISDLLIAMRTMNVSKKIKEKKFKEIIYDEDKNDEQEKKQFKDTFEKI